jgi:predicted nuclease of predicted toxin-antitoxin system
MLVLLLNAGLPYRAAAWPREHGTEAIHVRDIRMGAAADPEILEYARQRRQVCITLDHDFHRILAEMGETTPSVLLLQTQFTGYLETARLIARLVSEYPDELAAGVAMTAAGGFVRFRKLPLRPVPI